MVLKAKQYWYPYGL